MSDYAARCAAATTAQGLDPVIAALQAAGVTVDLHQTGGFCMVVGFAAPSGEYVAVNADSDSADAPYLFVTFPSREVWDEGEDDGTMPYGTCDLDRLVAVAQGR